VFALRFQVAGERHYVRLGGDWEGWDRKQAEASLRHTMADVERGTWQPPKPEPVPDVARDPTFHEFSSEWFDANKGEWQPKTRLDYEWQLRDHLLPFFKNHRLSQITIAEVDRYRAHKVKQATLSATSINKTITRLGQILEVALEYELVERNVAKGKRRRLKAAKPTPVWLDRAEQVQALLEASGDLDRRAKERGGHDQKGGPVYRRALLATLVFAGLRIGELIALRWRDVDLAGGRITVRAGKTDAAARQIDLLPVLQDELATLKANAEHIGPEDFVFATSAGTVQRYSNIYKRVFKKAVEGANKGLEKAGEVPLPDGLSPHKLRHTYASLLVALGTDPGAAMDQLGHTDPGFTLGVYRHAMRRDAAAKDRLQALVEGRVATDMEPAATDVEPNRRASEVAVSGSRSDSETPIAAIEDNGQGSKAAH
jgi:integrase